MEWKKIIIIIVIAVLVIFGIWGVIMLVDSRSLRKEQQKREKRTGMRCRAIHQHRTPSGGILTTKHCKPIHRKAVSHPPQHPYRSSNRFGYDDQVGGRHQEYRDRFRLWRHPGWENDEHLGMRTDGISGDSSGPGMTPITTLQVVPNEEAFRRSRPSKRRHLKKMNKRKEKAVMRAYKGEGHLYVDSPYGYDDGYQHGASYMVSPAPAAFHYDSALDYNQSHGHYY